MIENITVYDTIIIGSGPAGLTAAIYNVRADLKTIVLAGNEPGGQLTITTTVDNYPGFANGIGGIKLMMDMQQQVKNLGVEIRQGAVKKIDSENPTSHVFVLELEDGIKLESRAVIMATGAAAKWLNLPKEKDLIGKGVSGCATCDGMFFRDKIVVVVGGGDTACEEANFLSKFASKVYLIHRRDEFRASAVEQKKVLDNSKIEIVWNTEVVEINPPIPPFDPPSSLDKLGTTDGRGRAGSDKLNSIKVVNNKNGEEKIITIDGLFVAIGRLPATGFVKNMVELDENGYIVVGKHQNYPTMTSTPGIFAAGDCMDDIYRQAIVSAGAGCMAGLDAEKWLETERV